MKVAIVILAILLIAVVAFLCVGFALDWSFIPPLGGQDVDDHRGDSGPLESSVSAQLGEFGVIAELR